jgi:uncharacterized protein YegP (UPF0339 family)
MGRQTVAAARFRILQHRSAAGDTAEAGTLSWRLLATNNRDLGRAPEGYPDVEACRVAIRDLQATVGKAEPITVRSGPSSWGWRLMIGDRVVVVASRLYQRRIQAEQAAGVVLDLIPTAELAGL